MPRTGNLPTQPRGRAEHWKRNRLVLRIYIALAMFNIASSCPRTVSMGGVWPDGAPMDRLESSDGTARCCMFPWVDASTFGTAEELSGQNVNLAVDTVVCTSSKTLEEFAAAFLSGDVSTPISCTESCDAWGPPLGQICCDGNSVIGGSPVEEEITAYHTVPWLPVDLCPASGSEDRLIGLDLDSTSSLRCPEDGATGSEQTVVFSSDLNQYFKSQGGSYVLAFHRKLQLSPLDITFQVTDANGATVIPRQSVTFKNDESVGRRHLLKGAGGRAGSGGAGGSKGGSSAGSSVDGSSSKSPVLLPSSSFATKSGNSYTSTTSFNGATRYSNTNGYPVPLKSDFTSGQVPRGTVLASTGGAGAIYWGSTANRGSPSYYGAPVGFGNSWYPGGYSSFGYGYGGSSYWRLYVPIILWSRPFGCGYSCHYYGSRQHNASNGTQEFRTLYLPCDMAMELVMDSAFSPGDFQLPFTLTVSSASAAVTEAAGNCVGDASNATGPYLNSTSTPGSPALFATFVRMADVEVMEGSAAAFHSLQAAACAIALAGVFSFAALIQ